MAPLPWPLQFLVVVMVVFSFAVLWNALRWAGDANDLPLWPTFCEMVVLEQIGSWALGRPLYLIGLNPEYYWRRF